jgi:hypothetical protein
MRSLTKHDTNAAPGLLAARCRTLMDENDRLARRIAELEAAAEAAEDPELGWADAVRNLR